MHLSYKFSTTHTVSHEFLKKLEEPAECHQTLSCEWGVDMRLTLLSLATLQSGSGSLVSFLGVEGLASLVKWIDKSNRSQQLLCLYLASKGWLPCIVGWPYCIVGQSHLPSRHPLWLPGAKSWDTIYLPIINLPQNYVMLTKRKLHILFSFPY